jgi:hypothetical protein
MSKIKMKKFVNSKAKKGVSLCQSMLVHDEKGKEWL